MTIPELIKALQRLKVETESIACLGCGHEHNCGIHGCAFGPCVDCRVPYEFFCANGRYKRNAGGAGNV